MADYWKSNPRKFCEVCKCWIAENRASIDFHEGGRRHQANVKKKLDESRTRFSEKAKEKLNLEKMMGAIEHAAFNSYQQDMAGIVKKTKLPKPGVERIGQAQQFLAAEQQTLEREKEKKKIEKLAQEKVHEIRTKIALEAMQTAAVESEWQQCFSPEGYAYYYNNNTGASQWEIPKNFQPQLSSESSVGPTMTTGDIPPVSTTNSSDSTQPTNKESLKRSAQQARLEDAQNHQFPKRTAPYGGAWMTVAIIEREEEQEEGDEKDDEEVKKEERGGEGKIQFEEKMMPGGLGREENWTEFNKDNLKSFSFKKRANKDRTKMRPRSSDIM